MRKLIVFAMLTIAVQSCNYYVYPARKVPDSYSNTYKDIRKEELKEFREESKEYDIVIDPIERIPFQEYGFFAQADGNWGEKLLLPASLRQELADKWKWPVFIKVFDTGGKYNHPDLQEGQVAGRNYTTSPGLEDIQGHSTHVAGIIAGKDFGMLYDAIKLGKVRFQPIKILSDSGSGSFSWIANAFEQEEKDNDALRAYNWRVIVNGSFGGGTSIIQLIEQHLKNGYNKGTHFVFAAGNTGREVNYPGMSPYSITASSIDESMKISSFSSRGPQIDHAAPGGKINSTYKNGYAVLSGTSMATPFLTSLTAIAIGLHGEKLKTVDQTRAYLRQVATDLGDKGKDDLYGYGIHFVQHMLDNPPKDDNSQPNPEPEPDPVIPNPNTVVNLLNKDSYLAKWSKPGLSAPKTARIEEVYYQIGGNESEEVLYDKAASYFESYFSGGSLGFNNSNATGYDAIYSTGFFLEYIAKRKGIDIKVLSIIGLDEQNRRFVISKDFSKSTYIQADYITNK